MATVPFVSITLASIKRSAKRLRQQQGIPHFEALDAAARQAGFQGYKHARRQLGEPSGAQATAPGRHVAYITAYWRDTAGGLGRETLALYLSKPLSDLDRPQRILDLGRGGFRRDAADHLETILDCRNQLAARERVSMLGRTLQFMDATGVISARRRDRELIELTRRMEGRDHSSFWVYPEAGTEVMLDEPYADDLLAKRAPWLSTKGLRIVEPAWGGTHSPGQCTPYLISSDADLLREMSKRLAQLPTLDGQWTGISAPYTPQFISPARRATGRAKRSRPEPVVAGRVKNGALPYGGIMVGPGVCWRPARQIPLDVHRQLASLLRGLEAIGLPSRDHDAVEWAKCTLDDWVQREFTQQELPNDVFHTLYYGSESPGSLGGLSPVAALERVRTLLSKHYNDCVPLRSMLRSLDTVARHMREPVRRRRSAHAET